MAARFDDAEKIGFDIRSCWRQYEQRVYASEAQTEPIRRCVQGVQVRRLVATGTGYDVVECEGKTSLKDERLEEKPDDEAGAKACEVLTVGVVGRLFELMEAALVENERSSVLEAMSFLNGIHGGAERKGGDLETSKQAQLVYNLDTEKLQELISAQAVALQVPPNGTEGSVKNSRHYSATCLSWNATGSKLACGFGDLGELTLSHNPGYVYVFNLFARDPVTQACEEASGSSLVKTEIELETDSSVVSLDYHPDRPALLCCGTAIGEIYVWEFVTSFSRASTSTAKLDCLVCKTTIETFTHCSYVWKIRWLPSTTRASSSQKASLQFLSLARDGKVLIWDLSLLREGEKSLVVPIRGFTLQQSVIGSGGLHDSPRYQPTYTPCAVAFSSQQSFSATSDIGIKYFIIGTEGGHLLHCEVQRGSLINQKAKSKDRRLWSSNALRLLNVLPEQNRHIAKRALEVVAQKKGSKQIRSIDVFTSEVDLKILYPRCVKLLYERHVGPVYGVKFSRFHRKIFASGGTDGFLRIFRVFESKPLLSIPPVSLSIA